jgi:hypothetical protein
MTVGKCVLWGNQEVLAQRDRAPRVRCVRVWKALESKLQGKGRPRRNREWVWLPPVQAPSIEAPTKAVPGHPPTIWGSLPTA